MKPKIPEPEGMCVERNLPFKFLGGNKEPFGVCVLLQQQQLDVEHFSLSNGTCFYYVCSLDLLGCISEGDSSHQ